MAKGVVIVGGHIQVNINGKAVGKLTAIRYTSDTPRKEIYGLDSTVPYELAPTIAKVSGTIQLVRTEDDGGLEGLGVVAHDIDLINERYFTLTLVNRRTDKVIFQADQCSVLSQSWEMPSKSLVQGQFSFIGIKYTNEAPAKGS